ncbi:hypothetical protein TRIUR3_27861 [Triticum urartu]|uniref:Uncharacterized protein n=1 Tax=Triticum urartu TaxID=4572 RepID=M7YJG6_TRIUA|nr:hypothetical protein TRIUR3_27861 [Triticum urartu]
MSSLLAMIQVAHPPSRLPLPTPLDLAGALRPQHPAPRSSTCLRRQIGSSATPRRQRYTDSSGLALCFIFIEVESFGHNND